MTGADRPMTGGGRTVATRRAVEVVRAGPLCTVQDLGRPGYAHLGVPRSGAVDPPALRLANRLVGNPEGAAGLEVTVTGCVLRPLGSVTIAVTGGYAAVRVDGRPVAWGLPRPVPAGAEISVGPCRTGVRSYVAISGGVAVPAVLGSRSTDTLSGLGPAAVRDGDVLPLGEPAGQPPAVDHPAPVPYRSAVVLRVRPGPRAGWFATGLAGTSYVVSPTGNRVGVRLRGPSLPRSATGSAADGSPRELPSEGMVLGAVQVPADGQPLIFMADHPTTGGYPVVAVVHPDDLPALAQARPGTPVTFRPARPARPDRATARSGRPADQSGR